MQEPPSASATPESYRYPIESVENAARTLLMLRTQDSIRTVDVAKELGTARSTAHRMVSTLTQTGLLRRNDQDKSYSAGPELLRLARGIVNSGDIRTEIEPALSHLVERTGETAHFLVLQDDWAVFVACVESRHIIRAVSRVGHRMPAHITSAGKCLLAALSQDRLADLYAPDREWSQGTEMAIHGREHLLAELAQISSRGWALNNEESEPGLIGVSMAVRDPSGAVLGAVTVSGPAERTRPRIQQIVDALRDVTEDFSRSRL